MCDLIRAGALLPFDTVPEDKRSKGPLWQWECERLQQALGGGRALIVGRVRVSRGATD